MKRALGFRELSDDHHASLVLARRCKHVAREAQDASRDDRGRLSAEVARHLAAHFEIEERLLLPALEALGELAAASRIREEHARLRAAADGVPEPEALAQLGQQLEAHVRFEEREVFEGVQGRVPQGVREALAEAWRRAHELAPR